MRRILRFLDKVFGQQTPEGVDEQYWSSRHDRIHNRPFLAEKSTLVCVCNLPDCNVGPFSRV